MNEKMFTVLIKDESYKYNEFILGQLTGVAKMMYEMKIVKHFCLFAPTDSQTMIVQTTEDNWKSFIKTIRKNYRGLCEFKVVKK